VTSNILLIALGTLCFHERFKTADGFAISSSSTPSKKNLSNQSKKSSGFGKKDAKSVPIQHTADTSESTQTLMNFLLSQKSSGFGSADAGTEIGFNNNNNVRGMYATKPFKKGEIICRIPSDCALALCNPELGGGDIPTPAHAGRNYLLFYIFDEQARKFWAPYLDTLPTLDSNFDRTPDFFSDDEIEALEFPLAIDAAKKRRQQLIDLVESEENEDITMENVQFATWLALSRSFAIQLSNNDPNAPQGIVSDTDRKAIRVLLPYLDLINHSSNNANTELHLIDPEKDEAWFSIRASRSIKSGKEITIAYGTGVESSVELLQNYGFVPDENKIDRMMLSRVEEGTIETLEGWSTTLEEDLKALESDDLSENMRKVLQLRCKLKSSYE